MTRKKFLLNKKFQNAKQKFWRFDIDWNSGPVRQRLVSIAFQSSDNDWAVSELDWPQCRKIASYFYDFALIINQPGADSATVAQVPPPRSTFLARSQRCGRATSWTDRNVISCDGLLAASSLRGRGFRHLLFCYWCSSYWFSVITLRNSFAWISSWNEESVVCTWVPMLTTTLPNWMTICISVFKNICIYPAICEKNTH